MQEAPGFCSVAVAQMPETPPAVRYPRRVTINAFFVSESGWVCRCAKELVVG